MLLTANLCLALAALGWLALLSPPAHWFDAEKGEARVAVPVERLSPRVSIEAIQGDINWLDRRISDHASQLISLQGIGEYVAKVETRVEEAETQLGELQGGTGSSNLEFQLQELESQLEEHESQLEEHESRVSDAQDAQTEAQDAQAKVESLCDALATSDGALFDLYIAAC